MPDKAARTTMGRGRPVERPDTAEATVRQPTEEGRAGYDITAPSTQPNTTDAYAALLAEIEALRATVNALVAWELGPPTRDEIRAAVACPECGAVMGAPCIRIRGEDRRSNHRARIGAYRRERDIALVESLGGLAVAAEKRPA